MIRPLLYSGLLVIGLAALPATAETVSFENVVARAEAGDAAAQTALAFLYHQGNGVAQNYATAAQWATRAAQAGDARAQNLLGRYYHGGLGVKQNQGQALHWLTEAAKTDGPQFLYDLGRALEHGADSSTDPAAASQVYGQAANLGHLEATVSLGLLYQEGLGIAQDFEQARALYEHAAAKGHARAQNNLGLLYVRGNGVPQDYEKAAELFTAAAQQGLPGAIRNLGVMYENGFGVVMDEAYAAELYRQAGQGGSTSGATPALAYDPRLQPLPDDPAAMEDLRQIAGAGDPVAQFQLGWSLLSSEEPDFAALSEAAALFKAAAETGYGPAMRNFGILYFEGRGVPQDYVLGRMWLTLAGATGQADAPALIQALGATMTPAQINEAQSLVLTHSKRKP